MKYLKKHQHMQHNWIKLYLSNKMTPIRTSTKNEARELSVKHFFGQQPV